MAVLSIGERIILHLDRFKHIDPNDIYNIPWDLTQDGIATSLRISRAHASIELKKLRETHKVLEHQVHVKGGKVRRKTYNLTPAGMEKSEEIKKKAEKYDIDIAPMLDMKRCDPNDLLDVLSTEDAFGLGCACVFRVPVPLSILPKVKKSVIPTDVNGLTVIDNRLRENLFKVAEPERLAQWHSYAADYWLDDDEVISVECARRQERLYHLIKAGRNREACKLISSSMYDFIGNPNDDLNDMLSEVVNIPSAQAADVLTVKIEVSLWCCDIDVSMMIQELRGYDPVAASMYDAELVLREGDADKAISILEAAENGGDSSAVNLRLAKILMDAERWDDAKQHLDDAKRCIAQKMDAGGVSEMFIQYARMSMHMGEKDDAARYLSKAWASASDIDRKRINALKKEMEL